jgi:hypothetical protein
MEPEGSLPHSPEPAICPYPNRGLFAINTSPLGGGTVRAWGSGAYYY